MFTSNFTSKEVVVMYDNYFQITAWERTYFEIVSKNTGHYWVIIKPDEPISNECMVEVLHKYKRKDYYHHQCYCKTIDSAVKKIKAHDTYFLNKMHLA